MRCRPARFALLLWACVGVATHALAQQAPVQGGIYTCVDERGRRLTSDRPIADCHNRDQRVLNRDGSVRTVIAPQLTADERAEAEARDKRAAELRASQTDAYRRDRNLIVRYPDEAAHGRARESALDSVRVARTFTERRLQELARERTPLTNEAEFYKGKKLPTKLKQALDANDAAAEAQHDALATQEIELERINKLYDAERERLRRLWAGAVPGTLGPGPAAASGAPAASAAIGRAPHGAGPAATVAARKPGASR